MEDAVRAPEGCIEDVRLGNVAARLEDPDARVAQRASKVLDASADEVVVDHYFGDVPFGQQVNRMRSNQTGAANHNKSLPTALHPLAPDNFKRQGCRYRTAPSSPRKTTKQNHVNLERVN